MLGDWWLVNSDQQQSAIHKQPGTVSTNPDGQWQLSVKGSLLSNTDQYRVGTEPIVDPKTILGTTINGDSVSLLNAYRSETGSSVRFGTETRREIWLCDTYVVGQAHVLPPTTFTHTTIRFDLMQDWSVLLPSQSGRSFADGCGNEVLDTWIRSTRIKEVDLDLVIGWTTSRTNDSIHHDREASFRLNGTLSMRGLREEWVHPLQQLMHFFTLHPVSPSKVEATIIPMGKSDTSVSVLVSFQRADPVITDRQKEQVWWGNMFVPLTNLLRSDIAIEELLRRWFDFYHEHGSNINTYLASCLPGLFADSQMHLICRAVEAYHSKYIGGGRVPVEDHIANSRIVKEAIDHTTLPTEYKNWIKSTIGENRKGFKRQVDDVLQQSGCVGRKILGLEPTFSDMVRNQRNQSVHPSRSPEDADFIADLIVVTGIQWILRYAYLRRLGIEEDQVESLFENSHAYSLGMRYLEFLVEGNRRQATTLA